MSRKEKRNMFDRENVRRITEEYYSRFCGTDITKLKDGLHFVCTSAREEMVKGYGCRFLIYILKTEKLCVISYAPSVQKIMDEVKDLKLKEEVIERLAGLGMRKSQLMMFEEEKIFHYGNAQILSKEDYPLFEEFFKTCHPDLEVTGWLREYFEEKSEKEYFAGYIENGQLVCVSDAPDMPYLDGTIQHTGIETLANERRKGYAKCTSALATHHLLERGICPQWECAPDNLASRALARSIGYREFVQAYILEG